VKKPLGKQPLGRKRKWEGNIKMNFWEGCVLDRPGSESYPVVWGAVSDIKSSGSTTRELGE